MRPPQQLAAKLVIGVSPVKGFEHLGPGRIGGEDGGDDTILEMADNRAMISEAVAGRAVTLIGNPPLLRWRFSNTSAADLLRSSAIVAGSAERQRLANLHHAGVVRIGRDREAELPAHRQHWPVLAQYLPHQLADLPFPRDGDE